jgi:hypothetical protein
MLASSPSRKPAAGLPLRTSIEGWTLLSATLRGDYEDVTRRARRRVVDVRDGDERR